MKLLQRLVLACAICALCGIVSAAQPAGTSVYTEVLPQPTTLSAAGGNIAISVSITDSVGVQSAWVSIRCADGNETTTDLKRQGGTTTKAVWTSTAPIDHNWSEADQFIKLIFSSKNTLGKYSRSADVMYRQGSLPPNRPRIALTSMPRYFTNDAVSGTVYNANPADFAAAALINVPGWGLVAKPYCSNFMTALDKFGRFSQGYETGGNDGAANWIAVYLMPKDAKVGCINSYGSLAEWENTAVDRAGGYRDTFQPAKQIKFGENIWEAKTGGGANNFFAEQVTLDSQGMHFKLSPCHNPGKTDPNALLWCSAEARLMRPTGYGTYTTTVTGRLGQMFDDIAGGLSIHSDQSSPSNQKAIDLQFWKNPRLDQNQHQFVVQPAGTETQKRYAVPAGLTTATFRFRWEPDRITYTAWSGSAPEPTPQTQLAAWTFDRTSSSVDVPPMGDQRVHFSLWYNGRRSNPGTLVDEGQEEVVLSSFRYDPIKPGFLSTGIKNSGSYLPGAVTPGMMVSIFGYALGNDAISYWVPVNGAVPTELASTRVYFDGIPAAILYSQWGQVNAVVPFSLRGRDVTDVVVEYFGIRSDPVRLQVLPTLPGIFSLYGNGMGQGAIVNADGSLNGPGNPVARGGSVSMWVTGVGDFSRSIGDNEIISGSNPPTPTQPMQVTVGNVPAKVTYAAAVPGVPAGVVQVNVQIPPTAPVGNDVPILVVVGDRPSQGTITLAVK